MVAGIAGSPHMISATIISLSKVVYEFRREYSTSIKSTFRVKQRLTFIEWLTLCLRFQFSDDVPSALLEKLIQGILVCLRSTAREVIKSCLGFFKVRFP